MYIYMSLEILTQGYDFIDLKEREIDVREKYGSAACRTSPMGNQTSNLWFKGRLSNRLSHLAKAICIYLFESRYHHPVFEDEETGGLLSKVKQRVNKLRKEFRFTDINPVYFLLLSAAYRPNVENYLICLDY